VRRQRTQQRLRKFQRPSSEAGSVFPAASVFFLLLPSFLSPLSRRSSPSSLASPAREEIGGRSPPSSTPRPWSRSRSPGTPFACSQFTTKRLCQIIACLPPLRERRSRRRLRTAPVATGQIEFTHRCARGSVWRGGQQQSQRQARRGMARRCEARSRWRRCREATPMRQCARQAMPFHGEFPRPSSACQTAAQQCREVVAGTLLCRNESSSRTSGVKFLKQPWHGHGTARPLPARPSQAFSPPLLPSAPLRSRSLPVTAPADEESADTNFHAKARPSSHAVCCRGFTCLRSGGCSHRPFASPT